MPECVRFNSPGFDSLIHLMQILNGSFPDCRATVEDMIIKKF